MFIKFLTLALLATIAVAEIPSYIKVCGRKNPNLDQCILDNVKSLRDKLRTGIPELDVPPIEPLEIKTISLSNTETFHSAASNVKISGLSNYEIKSLHSDLASGKLNIEVVFKEVVLDGDYKLDAKIIVPIKGEGPMHVVAEQVRAVVSMQNKKVEKNGAVYLYFSSMTTNLEIKDFTATFEPINDPGDTIKTAIKASLEGGRQELLEAIRPTLEKFISERVLDIANKICKRFTYEELHPNRE